MAVDVFQEPRRALPKQDPRVLSQDLQEQQMGARKSHIPNPPKNGLTIRHVEKGR